MSLLLYCDLNDYSSLDNSSEWNMADPSMVPFSRMNFPTSQITNTSLIGPDKYYLFNGNSYVSIPGGSIQIPFSINFWVYLSTSSNGGNVLKNEENSFAIHITNQEILIEEDSFNYTIPLSTWININLEYTTSDEVNLYINGEYLEQITRVNTEISSSLFKILEGYSGGLAWLRTYDTALSTEMIKGLYESCMTLSNIGEVGISNIQEAISLTEENPISLKNSLSSKKTSYMPFHGEYVSTEDMTTIDEPEPYIFPTNIGYPIKNIAPVFNGTINTSGISIPNFSLPYAGNLVAFIIEIKPSSSVNATFSTKSGATSFNTRTFNGLSSSSFNKILYLTKPKSLSIDTILLTFSATTTIQYQNYRVLLLTSSGIENYLENNNILLGIGTTSYYDVSPLLSWCDTKLKPLVFTDNQSVLSLPNIAIENPDGYIFNTDRKYGGTAFIANEISEFIFPETAV